MFVEMLYEFEVLYNGIYFPVFCSCFTYCLESFCIVIMYDVM
jgi:hypothetical protein